MSHASFAHLRLHSAYSLSEGALTIKNLVKRCAAEKMPAAAVTDTNNLFGAMEFALTAREAGLQPIIGVQLSVDAGSEAGGGLNGSGLAPAPDQLVLLVQNETGYKNLLQLVSRAYLESDPGETVRTSYDELALRGQGLIALSGGVAGPLGRLLSAGQDLAAQAHCRTLKSLFPGRLYIELQRHGLEEEIAIEEALISLADSEDLPLVATNEAFFAEVEDFEPHDALLCIAEGTTISNGARRRLTVEHRLKSPSEMRLLFADLPEALENTLVIARRCAYFPDTVAPILPAFPTAEGRSEAEELGAQAAAGLEQRLAAMPDLAAAEAQPYRDRLTYELGVIEQMGFPGYFLIVADFIQWAKNQGIPVGPGRGSGAGSVVAWALTITDLDPLALGPAFRAVLESRTRLDAGLRHRLLPGPARRGHRLRSGQIRLRPCGADHHVRKAPGPSGVARRGPGAWRCPIPRSTGSANWCRTTLPIP